MAELKRSLGAGATLAIVIGGVIGSGIFMKPALMASQLNSPLLLLSVWLLAGSVTLCGALSNAEAAAMFPETGGQFIFFQKMYGRGFAFVYGWASFAVINTAGNASIAYVCAEYLNSFLQLPRFSQTIENAFSLHIPFVGELFPLQNIGVKVTTALLLTTFCIINYRSVRYSGRLQGLLTSLKAAAIIVLIAGVFFCGNGSLSQALNGGHPPSGWPLVGAYIAALSGAFWAFDGWNNITFVAGEIQDPQKNIPRSLFTGLLFCTLVYLLLNLAYLFVLPIDDMAGSTVVASDVASSLWGAAGGAIVACMVILSTAGATNANVLATARVTYAMGQESIWFKRVGRVHPRFSTPGNALLLNTVWAIILVFSGSFDMLTDMLIFVTWFFYGMSSLGIIILRVKMKQAIRPYKVWGYPIVPLVFVLFTFLFLSATLYWDFRNYETGGAEVVNSLLGILLTALGIPIFFFSRKRLNISSDE